MKAFIRGRQRLALGAAAVVLAVGGGTAYAATMWQAQARNHSGARAAIVDAVTADLGITAQQLRSDLRGGQTLAQIATANGKSVSGLEQTILAAVQSRLDQAVAAGKLTNQREQALLARVGTRLGKLVNVEHPVAHLVRLVRWRAYLVRTGASYLGVTPHDLRSQLRSGTTLAQIAAANGKSVSGLEQAVESAAKARLDQAVTAGKLTPDREQAILSKLQTTLDTVVNGNFAG